MVAVGSTAKGFIVGIIVIVIVVVSICVEEL